MALQIHEIGVVRTEEHDERTVTQHFSRPEGFSWEPGQFVVLQVELDGKPVRRSYSIASAPQEEDVLITVRAQKQGLVSPYLCAMETGSQAKLLGPFGHFTLPAEPAPLLLIGAGTGMSPFRSFLVHLNSIGYSEPITVLQCSKTPEQLLFLDEIETLDIAVTHVQTITRPETSTQEWTGRVGRIDKELIAQYLQLGSQVYICGSTPMVKGMQMLLSELGVDKERVHTEKFGNVES